jgi:hypothetical protein
MAIDHAPSVQIADGSTDVTVPRSPLTAQGPSGLPRIPPPAPVPAEFGEHSSRRSRSFAESIAPATGSIFPASVSRTLGNRTILAAAAAVIGVGVLVLLFRPSSGSMLLTVGGPGGAAVQGISVKVDGTERCTSTPCEIAELKAGTHVITATASGITGETEETLRVERGEQTAHHLALKGEKVRPPEPPAEEKPAPVAEAPKEEPKAEEEKPAPVAEAPKEQRAAPVAAADEPRPQKHSTAKAEPVASASRNTRPAAVAQKSAPASTKPEPKPAAPVAIAGAGATLDLSSTPRAAVVVNGRPMGMTPLKGVKVPAGRQTIVFVHPDLGRKVASANLAPGARTTVGMKF